MHPPAAGITQGLKDRRESPEPSLTWDTWTTLLGPNITMHAPSTHCPNPHRTQLGVTLSPSPHMRLWRRRRTHLSLQQTKIQERMTVCLVNPDVIAWHTFIKINLHPCWKHCLQAHASRWTWICLRNPEATLDWQRNSSKIIQKYVDSFFSIFVLQALSGLQDATRILVVSTLFNVLPKSGVVTTNTRQSRNFNITGSVRQRYSMQIATRPKQGWKHAFIRTA